MATQKEVADHLDLSTKRIQELTKSGILPPVKGRGGIDIDACRIAYIRHLRGIASGQVKTSDEGLVLEKERARLAARQADKHELQNAEMRKELLPADRVRMAWLKVVSAARNKFLSVPTRAAAQVRAAQSNAEVQAILSDLINEALEEIHDEINIGAAEESI